MLLILVLLYCNNAMAKYVDMCKINRLSREPIIIMFSFDGLRKEYLTQKLTPNLLALRKIGVYSDSLTSLNLANALSVHHTIATGYYPKHHAVIGHKYLKRYYTGYKVMIEHMFTYGSQLYKNQSRDRQVIPLWTLNEIQGGMSAVMMWPGAEFPYGNDTYPTYYIKYNSNMSMKQRFQLLEVWLNMTYSLPNLIMVYIESIDKLAHAYGIHHKKVRLMIQEIDARVGRLHKHVRKSAIGHRVNFFFVSDHGMYQMQYKDLISIKARWGKGCKVPVVGVPTIFQQDPKKLGEEDCYDDIAADLGRRQFLFSAQRRSLKELNTNRLSTAAGVAPEGHAWLETAEPYIRQWEKKYSLTVTNNSKFGIHGYIVDKPGIFFAEGPIFAINKKVPPFDVADIYCGIAYGLEMRGYNTKPKRKCQHDGNFTRIKPIFEYKQIRKPVEEVNWMPIIIMIMICATLTCATFYVAIIITERVNIST